jgi:hypothetical protein
MGVALKSLTQHCQRSAAARVHRCALCSLCATSPAAATLCAPGHGGAPRSSGRGPVRAVHHSQPHHLRARPSSHGPHPALHSLHAAGTAAVRRRGEGCRTRSCNSADHVHGEIAARMRNRDGLVGACLCEVWLYPVRSRSRSRSCSRSSSSHSPFIRLFALTQTQQCASVQQVAVILLCYEVRVWKRPTSACIVFLFAVDCGAGTVGTRPCSACP